MICPSIFHNEYASELEFFIKTDLKTPSNKQAQVVYKEIARK